MTEALIVACPACNTLNRAPREKLAAGGGKCGSCGVCPVRGSSRGAERRRASRPMPAKSDIPLLVDFWAPWCGPCKAMAPQFEKAAGQLEPKVRFAKVNTDEEQQLAGRFGIQGIPTMILFQPRQGDRPPVRPDERRRHRAVGAAITVVAPSCTGPRRLSSATRKGPSLRSG